MTGNEMLKLSHSLLVCNNSSVILKHHKQTPHGLWCQDCTLANSSHCAPKQCQPTDTVCASVRITDPSSSKSGPAQTRGVNGTSWLRTDVHVE
ncbi:hypothetical protein STEG23_037606 [Scotinomys teguina]